MKKKILSLVLAFCLLFSVISFSASAEADPIPVKEAPATEDFPLEANIDYLPGQLWVNTKYVVDLSLYEGEGPFDFHGIQITDISYLFADYKDPNELFEDDGYVTYIINFDSINTKDAIAVLKQDENIERVDLEWYIYTPEDVPPAWKKGDIGRNGTVDVFDYLAVKSHYFGTTTLKGHPLERADVNKDGTIDLFDYMEIKAMCFE